MSSFAGDNMRCLLVIMTLTWTTALYAQQAPRDYKVDTPPPPGHVVEPMRERLRLAPSPLRVDRSGQLGLPSTGPKGLLRESNNEPRYAPSSDR